MCVLDEEGQFKFTKEPEINDVVVINLQDSTTKVRI